ncbi:uncharacterized protein I206_102698 [Kwoniella pini CBS 10737]|uniref:BZIP domain-containing protein n=1 Tax=Kwoniella pini CBS 10737 TaxID=1296096 RepID=A0A1B9I636_9TREE|nr:uncharacterized protein I206_03051 [Kwoniella pini CBS 10737]OCF50989.1 hypothetical protein I206_03051 [Kwoniella pini CBS 10737]
MNTIPITDEKSAAMAATWSPSWGSYLYQNFLVAGAAAPTPTLDWLNATSQQAHQTSLTGVNNVGVSMNNVNTSAMDYFGLPASLNSANISGTDWADNSASVIQIKTEVDESSYNDQQQRQRQLQQQQQQQRQQAQAGPSSFYPQFYFSQSGGINTSLLTQNQAQNAVQDYSPESTIDTVIPSLSSTSQRTSTDSVHIVDTSLTRSPSPISSLVISPHGSPALQSVKIKGRPRRGGKKRSHSILSDSEASHTHDEHDHDHDHEHEPEVPEGVERDGMIWGMKVEDYRALSARERKRVRNRISARTFRAKRKEHLTSLEHDLGAKDLQIKIANDEANRLRKEVAELRRKLAKYEKQY